MAAVIKTLIFTLVLPCTVVVWAPWLWLVPGGPQVRLEGWRGLGIVLFVIGAAIYSWCAFWAFARVGGGTPAPIDPPRRLVVHGLYRYARNPMYIGVLLMLAAEAILFLEHRVFVIYALCVAAGFMLFVLLYEEPVLRRKFGAQYEEYCRQVPRWIPRLRHGKTRHAL